jgi:hypothetical protein
MSTPEEYRYQAAQFLKLADETTELYAKTSLGELAVEFRETAKVLERRRQSDPKQRSASGSRRIRLQAARRWPYLIAAR